MLPSAGPSGSGDTSQQSTLIRRLSVAMRMTEAVDAITLKQASAGGIRRYRMDKVFAQDRWNPTWAARP